MFRRPLSYKILFCFRFDSTADIAAFFFMFQNSAVELVHQNINRGVHILFNRFNVQIFTCQMRIGFGFLIDFFYRERNGHRDDVVGVAIDSCQLIGNIVFDGSVTSKFRPVIFRFMILLLRLISPSKRIGIISTR